MTGPGILPRRSSRSRFGRPLSPLDRPAASSGDALRPRGAHAKGKSCQGASSTRGSGERSHEHRTGSPEPLERLRERAGERRGGEEAGDLAGQDEQPHPDAQELADGRARDRGEEGAGHAHGEREQKG